MLTSMHDNLSFTEILPFNQDNLLEPSVQSDHAEIALKVGDQRVINVWNISNPTFHCYFKHGDNPPFHHSHLFVDKPFVDGIMENSLQKKIHNQIETIATRFMAGQVSVQVIVEGYESFFTQLADKITALGSKEFQIVSLLNGKPKDWKATANVTGILVDTSKFLIVGNGVMFRSYCEEQDSNKEKELYVPYVRLCDRNVNHTMTIVGVHVNGCGSQYPKTGLETFAKVILDLQIIGGKKSDIIATGDYNTTPLNVEKSLIEALGSQAVLLKTPYLTHVNPKSEAAIYDHVTVLKGEKPAKYEMLQANNVSKASQDLIKSIETSYEKKQNQ